MPGGCTNGQAILKQTETLQERLIWSRNIRSHYEKQYKTLEPEINMKCIVLGGRKTEWVACGVVTESSVMWVTLPDTRVHF